MNIPDVVKRIKALSGFSVFPPIAKIEPKFIAKLRSTKGLNFKESVGSAKVAAATMRKSRSMSAGLQIWRSLEKALGGSNSSVVNRAGKACGKERSHRGVLQLLDPICECKTVEDAHKRYMALLTKVCFFRFLV